MARTTDMPNFVGTFLAADVVVVCRSLISKKAEQSILRPNKAMAISIFGDPVVLDAHLCQSGPCIELFMNQSPVMSGLSLLLNTFDTSVTQSSLLRPSYDREILARLEEEFDPFCH